MRDSLTIISHKWVEGRSSIKFKDVSCKEEINIITLNEKRNITLAYLQYPVSLSDMKMQMVFLVSVKILEKSHS